jgi:hypothetical protein
MNKLPALAGALALLCTPPQAGAQIYQRALHQSGEKTVTAHVLNIRRHIHHYRLRTWHYQDMRDAKRSETRYLERNVHAVPRLWRLHHYWYKSAIKARHAYLAHQRELRAHQSAPSGLPPHYNEWLCIHGYEGSWNANTGNGFYGGLQMDYSFMQSYGGSLLASKGPASNWTPLEQMWVAERAYSSGRGFYPWPNTARQCGLI